ncbi:MAG: FeoC-like transcriptional regulator [Thiobacillaceae bacterium]|nr:FeoC-like transcriptional regulator [Thiobacillaceae bacterium]MDW8324150.1 FeoC-like transcriptional regulator [Burkholderiales bacterium]
MILTRIHDHLRQHRRASVADLARLFDSEPSAVRAMLEQLVRRGRVRRLPAGTPCGGGCCKCAPEAVELYEWIGD